ncbi:MAG: hypothetical protein ABWX92_12380 [Mycetocola sp.]
MPRYVLFNLLDGLILEEFDPVTGPWSVGINEAEDLKVTIDLNDDDEIRRNWRNLVSPWKTCLAVEQDGRWYGGPIQPRDWDEDDQTLTITAKGIMSWLEMLYVAPPSAETAVIINATTKLPNPALNTTFSGVDLGTIIKKLVQQACSWPGAGIPIAYQADRAGTATRMYEFLDYKTVASAIEDISKVLNGPEFRFELRQTDDTHLGWLLVTGTAAAPRLQSPTIHSWDSAAIVPSASGVSEGSDPSEMADIAFATGGRSADTAMVARAVSTTLRNAGFPLMMKLDSSHSDVQIQATLNGYAAEALRTGSKEIRFRKFSANAELAPFLNEYYPGDLCTVNVEGSGYLPDGAPERRIVKLSGDETGESIEIALGEVYE